MLNDVLSSKKEKSALRIVSSVLCAALLLVSAAACSSSSSSTTTPVQDTTVNTEESTSESESKYKEILDKNVGDLVTFGEYEWYLTDKSGGSCTLLSKDSLAKMKYNSDDSQDNTSWKGSQIYKWINDDSNIHFTDEEKSVMVKTDDGYVTLLTKDEIENLDKSIDRTDGSWWGYPVDEEKGLVPFLLTSFSDSSDMVEFGDIVEVGDVLRDDSGANIACGVRPAVRLNFGDEEEPAKEDNSVEENNSSEEKKSADKPEDYSKILDKDVYDVVHFGNYDWYIIDKTADSCTLLTKDIVTKKEYYDKEIIEINDTTWEDVDQVTTVTWENSTLRTWLNEDFYNEFSDEEKALIAKQKREKTEDNVYLLNHEEADELSKNEDVALCGEEWWLSSPGYAWHETETMYADLALPNGFGTRADSKDVGVRPAVTLKF